MRVHIGLILILFACFSMSCSTLPPEKTFKTELWQIDPINYTISRENDEGEIIVYNIEDLDNTMWIAVKLEHILSEWEYEKLLIKECMGWR